MPTATAIAYHCPVEFVLDTLGGKWSSVILAQLKEGERRYSELRALIPAISDKMLTQRLHDLVDRGFVERRSAARRSDYGLSERGERLRGVLSALYRYGTELAEAEGVEIDAPRLPISNASGD